MKPSRKPGRQKAKEGYNPTVRVAVIVPPSEAVKAQAQKNLATCSQGEGLFDLKEYSRHYPAQTVSWRTSDGYQLATTYRGRTTNF